jgi:hypothetical protein
MANQRNLNDPYDPDRLKLTDDNLSLSGDNFIRSARLDNELQPDPELAEGPASGGRVAMAAIAIAVVLGAVFYGLNNSSINQAGTAAPTQTAQTQPSPPSAPPGMRDVTPRSNAQPGMTNGQPGMTTGSAPARPQGAPSSAPTGQEVNQSGATPANPAPNSNDTK